MKNAIATTPQQRTLALFKRWQAQIATVLPSHLKPERVIQLTMVEFERNPELLKCTPQSIIASAMHIYQLGLEIGGHRGQAYIVPFRDSKRGITVCTPIIGYRGMCDLARRSGQVSTISAACVYANEVFSWEKGLAEKLVHRPKLKDRGAFVAAYAVCRLRDGGSQFEVLSADDIAAVRRRSKGKREDNPWNTDFEEMAKKTALRRLCKLLPFDVEMREAAFDEEPNYDVPQDVPGDVFEANFSPGGEGMDEPGPDDAQQDAGGAEGQPVEGDSEDVLAIARRQIAAAKSLADLQRVDEFFQRNDVSELCQARAEEIRASRGERSNVKATDEQSEPRGNA